MKGVKTSTLDTLFSKLIRERADWHCEACNKSFRNNPGGLHCSHHASRKYGAGRWHGKNASAHCASCHRKFTDNPLVHAAWVEDKFPAHALFVRTAKLTVARWRTRDKLELLAHLKAQLNAIQTSRQSGSRGWVNFVDWAAPI